MSDHQQEQLELEKASLPNMLPGQPYQRFGDKQNSDFFEEYLLKIYAQRDQTGQTANVRNMTALVMEVDSQMVMEYIAELSLMTLYHYVRSWQGSVYRWHLLQIDPLLPDLLIREKTAVEPNMITAMTQFGRRAQEKPQTKYVGEIYAVEDLEKLVDQLTAFGARFGWDLPKEREVGYVHWSEPSVYTWNFYGYQLASDAKQYPQRKLVKLSAEQLQLFNDMKSLQVEMEIDKYVLPYDHLATRVFAHDREHAILEHLRMTSYYYWGSFNIESQNSSTNVTRPVHKNGFGEVSVKDAHGQEIVFAKEALSPAKVFTANNTPYYVNDFVDLPSPTENFVRNFGRRMHHLAVAVRDGRFVEGKPVPGNEYLLLPEYSGNPDDYEYKYVDFVVDQLRTVEKEFLARVVGSCHEGLKQIFSKSSPFSSLITEYIQRCNEYQGFFTKKNVAALTAAAGLDEGVVGT